jgi:hypothetical protein
VKIQMPLPSRQAGTWFESLDALRLKPCDMHHVSSF